MMIALMTLLAIGPTAADTTASPTRSVHGIVVEVRAGAATGDFGGYGARNALIIDTSWRLQAGYAWRSLEISLGYGRIDFGCSGGMCAPTAPDYTSSGFDLALRARLGALWLQAGMMHHSLDIRWSASGDNHDRAQAAGQLGLMAAVGFEIGLYQGLGLVIGVNAVGYDATLPGAPHSDRVRVVGSDIGLRYRFYLGR